MNEVNEWPTKLGASAISSMMIHDPDASKCKVMQFDGSEQDHVKYLIDDLTTNIRIDLEESKRSRSTYII